MKTVLLIAIGGAVGALSRWGLARWADQWRGDTNSFPLGIFLANVLGCLLFGWLAGLAENRQLFSDAVKMGIFTGFLGSFTTFSTFGWNSFELLRSGQIGMALGNIAGSVVIGLLAVWAGYSIAR